MAEPKSLIILTAGTGGSAVSVVSTGQKAFFPIVEPMIVTEIGCLLVTVGTGTLIVDFDKRILVGSDTGIVDKGVGTITGTVATGVAVGKCLRKFVNVKVDKGDEIVADVTTALTSSGTGVIYVKGYAAGSATLEADDLAST